MEGEGTEGDIEEGQIGAVGREVVTEEGEIEGVTGVEGEAGVGHPHPGILILNYFVFNNFCDLFKIHS